MPQQFHRNEGFLDRCKSTSMSCARSTKSSASCKLSRKRNSKDKDAPNSPLVKHTIIAGRNRRESGAGYKCWTHEARLCVSVRRHDFRFAYSGRDQIVKFGYNMFEIRSKSVFSTSPSGYEALSKTGTELRIQCDLHPP